MAVAKHSQVDEESAVLEQGLTALAQLLAAMLVGAERDGPRNPPNDPTTEVESELKPQVCRVPASATPSEVETGHGEAE